MSNQKKIQKLHFYLLNVNVKVEQQHHHNVFNLFYFSFSDDFAILEEYNQFMGRFMPCFLEFAKIFCRRLAM